MDYIEFILKKILKKSEKDKKSKYYASWAYYTYFFITIFCFKKIIYFFILNFDYKNITNFFIYLAVNSNTKFEIFLIFFQKSIAK